MMKQLATGNPAPTGSPLQDLSDRELEVFRISSRKEFGTGTCWSFSTGMAVGFFTSNCWREQSRKQKRQ
jgi:hypothetical protein